MCGNGTVLKADPKNQAYRLRAGTLPPGRDHRTFGRINKITPNGRRLYPCLYPALIFRIQYRIGAPPWSRNRDSASVGSPAEPRFRFVEGAEDGKGSRPRALPGDVRGARGGGRRVRAAAVAGDPGADDGAAAVAHVAGRGDVG